MKNHYRKIMMIIGILVMTSWTGPLGAQDCTLTIMEQLGKELFFDKIASPDNMSCAECHAANVGFTGPIPGLNKKGAVYPGAVSQRFGNRKPPSAAYASLSPILHYDEDEELFIGGNFWDGRATGEHLGNPAADQALGPFLNPVEQNNPSKQAVLMQITTSQYAWMWELVWGEPIACEDPVDIETNYDRVGLAIAAYESSCEVNSFTSKYDYYLAGEVDLTTEEAWGLDLFNGIAMCSACHPSELGPEGEPPLFTDFTFDNLGVQKNPDNPFYDMDEVYLDDGSPINPLGESWIDPGLGGFLQSIPAYASFAPDNMGKHKVPTLRNVDKRPGNGFLKAYMHNGALKSLKEVVHFYNTRDVEDWPDPEVPENVNTDELGDLGLTDEQEDAIVAFMKTLSDGYNIKQNKALAVPQQFQDVNLLLAGPNPVRSSTNIILELPEVTRISMEVYNLSGMKVATLVNGFQPAGRQSINLNTSSLAGGVYILYVKSGNQIITKKITVLD